MMEKVTKKSVKFSIGGIAQHCGNCTNYESDKPLHLYGPCKRVEGTVTYADWCKLWSPK